MDVPPSWDLSVAYSSLADGKIEDDIKRIEECVESLRSETEQRESVAVMQKAILTSESAGCLLATIFTYANCFASVDATDPEAKALVVRMTKLRSEVDQAFSPYELSLTHAKEGFIESVLKHENGDVCGQAFAISQMRKLADIKLSVAEEQFLAALEVDGKHGWSRMYDNLTGSLQINVKDEKGTEEQLGFSQASSILKGSEFQRQKPIWHGIQVAMESHRETFASILNALAGWRLTEYQKRSFKRRMDFLEPSLHGSCIELQTLDAMMAVVKQNRQLGRKAGMLMAKVHGLDELKPWNYQAAMPPLNSTAKVYTFHEGVTLVREAFSSVSPEMGEFVDMMVEKGWIDGAPAPRKRLGAYCADLPASRCPLVFMTWNGSRYDLMTLAHELGHAFHSWVMRDMPLCQTNYPMTLAETASIFAENIVRDHLIAKANSVEEKLEMLWEELALAFSFFLNLPVRFEFEKAFYEKRRLGELTPEQLCDLMSEVWLEWYGECMSIPDPYFWASKLHFSFSDISFYNYPYIFGFLFSAGIYAQRSSKGDRFFTDYVQLLRDTGSMMAEEVVAKHLGMNLNGPDFWQQSVDIVKRKIDEFEGLLGKLKAK